MAKTINQRQNEAEVCMAEIKKDISFIKEEVTDLKETMKMFIEKSENRFASKWVENAIIAIGIALAGSILFALIKVL